MYRFVSLLFVAVFMQGIAFAQAGESGFAMLKFGIGARTIGMGDAGVASARNAPSMHYNPAIIGAAVHSGLTVMHNSLTEDVNSEYLGAYAALDGYSIGFQVLYTGIGEIEIRDRPGPAQGETSAHYISSGFTLGLPLSDQLEAGLTAKVLFEQIYEEDATGYAFDFGARYRPFVDGDLKDANLGISIANLGAMSKLRDTATTLPALLRYGASYPMQFGASSSMLNIEAGAVSNLTAGITHATVGVEYGYDGIAYLRAGYQTGYDYKDLSFGIGVLLTAVSFDFAYMPSSEGFGDAFALSISLTL